MNSVDYARTDLVCSLSFVAMIYTRDLIEIRAFGINNNYNNRFGGPE